MCRVLGSYPAATGTDPGRSQTGRLRSSSRISVSNVSSARAGWRRLLDEHLADEIDDQHHDDERDQGVDEQAPADGDLLALRVRPEDGLDRREVDAAQRPADGRHDDRVDQGGDDRPERDADDDADRQGKRIRLGQKRLEAAHRLSSCHERSLFERPDDTLANRPRRLVRRTRRDHGQGVPRRHGGGLRADRAGPHPRQPDARRRARQRRAGPDRAVDAQSPRPHRGRDRNGQDEDPPAPRRPAVEGGRPGLHLRHQGRRDRDRGTGRRDQPQGRRTRDLARLDVRAVGASGRVPVAVGQARRPGAGDRPLVRAAAPRQGARPQRHPDLDPRPRLQVLRRQRPAAARPQGPLRDAQVPVVRRGQADPGRLRRDVERLGRRAPALDRRARAAGRRHVLRRARVRRQRPAPDDARGRGDHQRPRAVRRHGQAPAVLDVHALDAGPAVRVAARGRRPAEAEAVLLLRRGAPPVRRCV